MYSAFDQGKRTSGSRCEFVSDVSEKSETVDAYKAEVKAKIKERKENEGKQKREDQSVEQAVANAEMDIPEAMISFQSRQMVDDFARRIMQQGMTMEQYFQFTGLSEEKMMEEFKPEAEKRIRTRLTLEAIVAAENIEVSEERLDEELQKMADSYKIEVDKLKEYRAKTKRNSERRHCDPRSSYPDRKCRSRRLSKIQRCAVWRTFFKKICICSSLACRTAVENGVYTNNIISAKEG